jgi:hypothetical protein
MPMPLSWHSMVGAAVRLEALGERDPTRPVGGPSRRPGQVLLAGAAVAAGVERVLVELADREAALGIELLAHEQFLHLVLGEAELRAGRAVRRLAVDLHRLHRIRGGMGGQRGQGRDLAGRPVGLGEQCGEVGGVPFQRNLHGLVLAAGGQGPPRPSPLLPLGAADRLRQCAEVHGVRHAEMLDDDHGQRRRLQRHPVGDREQVADEALPQRHLVGGRRSHRDLLAQGRGPAWPVHG